MTSILGINNVASEYSKRRLRLYYSTTIRYIQITQVVRDGYIISNNR